MNAVWIRLGLSVCLLLFALACVVGLSGALLNHAYTPDLPWLLATGDWIWAHHQLPTHDLFSWTMPDKPFVVYQWLFEVILSPLKNALGWQGLVRLFIVFVVVTYTGFALLLGRLNKVDFVSIVLPLSCAFLVLPINMSIRPMVATVVCLGLHYSLLQAYRYQRCPQWLVLVGTILIYAVWANLHMGVTLGFLMVALMALGDLLEQRGLYAYTGGFAVPRSWQFYGVVLLLGFLASLLNPYGFGIYTYFHDLSAQTYLNTTIKELQSPDFHLPTMFLFLLVSVGWVGTLPASKKTIGAGDLLILAVFSLGTLFLIRTVVWAVLFWVLILPGVLQRQVEQWHGPALNTWWQGSNRFKPFYLGALVLGSVLLLIMPFVFPPSKMGACEPLLPGLKTYLSHQLPGDVLLNDAPTGSCLLALDPQQKVFIDTRFDFYQQDFVKAQAAATFGLKDWQSYLNQYKINTIVMMRERPLVRLLLLDKRYRVIYEDDQLVALRR